MASELAAQLAPPDPALTVAIGLDTNGYSLPITPPSGGHLVLGWYLGTHPGVQDSTGLVPIAQGEANYGSAHPSQLTMTATPLGRRLIRRNRSLQLTAVATFTPTDQAPGFFVTTFGLA